MAVHVTGHLEERWWATEDGGRYSTVEIVADEVSPSLLSAHLRPGLPLPRGPGVRSSAGTFLGTWSGDHHGHGIGPLLAAVTR